MRDFQPSRIVTFSLAYDLAPQRADTRHVDLASAMFIDALNVVAAVEVTRSQKVFYAIARALNRWLPTTERWHKARHPMDVSEDLRLERLSIDDVQQTLTVLRLSAFNDMLEWHPMYLDHGQLALRIRNMSEQRLEFRVVLRGRTR